MLSFLRRPDKPSDQPDQAEHVAPAPASRAPMSGLERTLMGFRCKDSDAIPKVANAGAVERFAGQDVQIMHNGLKVVAGGYHGDWMAHLIRGLRGHHEPQEEAIFAEIVRRSRHNTTFVELGCFWAYYSLWYLREVPGSRAVCVEPDPANRVIGERNAGLNDLAHRMAFHSAMIGGVGSEAETFVPESTNEPISLPVFSFEEVRALAGGPIEVLHLDIQGFETAFLGSMPAAPITDVRFAIVSTHHPLISGSTTTHEDCVAELKARGAHILAEHSVEQSFSGDGLIVASFLDDDLALPMPEISRNTKDRSLFG